MNTEERDRIIASKLTEIIGIVCEGLGSQYKVYIETDTKISIKEKQEEAQEEA